MTCAACAWDAGRPPLDWQLRRSLSLSRWALTGILWAPDAAPLRCRWQPLQQDLFWEVNEIIYLKGLSSPVLIKWPLLLLLVSPKPTASNYLLPWYFFSGTWCLWRIVWYSKFYLWIKQNHQNLSYLDLSCLSCPELLSFWEFLEFSHHAFAMRSLQEMASWSPALHILLDVGEAVSTWLCIFWKTNVWTWILGKLFLYRTGICSHY